MDAAGNITRLNGVSAYTAQLALGNKGSQQNGASGQSAPASTPPAVRDTTKEANEKSFGIKLGKLGIRYVTEEPEVDYDAVAEEALKHAERTQAAAYKSEMEIALLLNEVHGDGAQSQQTENADPSPLQTRYGTQAYSRMAQDSTTDPGKGILLGVV